MKTDCRFSGCRRLPTQMVALHSIMMHLLASRPQSPRTHCIAADAFINLREPVVAITVANAGIAVAQAQPYHAAQLHLLAALAMEYGGLGDPTVPVAALSEVRVRVWVRLHVASSQRLSALLRNMRIR